MLTYDDILFKEELLDFQLESTMIFGSIYEECLLEETYSINESETSDKLKNFGSWLRKTLENFINQVMRIVARIGKLIKSFVVYIVKLYSSYIITPFNYLKVKSGFELKLKEKRQINQYILFDEETGLLDTDMVRNIYEENYEKNNTKLNKLHNHLTQYLPVVKEILNEDSEKRLSQNPDGVYLKYQKALEAFIEISNSYMSQKAVLQADHVSKCLPFFKVADSINTMENISMEDIKKSFVSKTKFTDKINIDDIRYCHKIFFNKMQNKQFEKFNDIGKMSDKQAEKITDEESYMKSREDININNTKVLAACSNYIRTWIYVYSFKFQFATKVLNAIVKCIEESVADAREFLYKTNLLVRADKDYNDLKHNTKNIS